MGLPEGRYTPLSLRSPGLERKQEISSEQNHVSLLVPGRLPRGDGFGGQSGHRDKIGGEVAGKGWSGWEEAWPGHHLSLPRPAPQEADPVWAHEEPHPETTEVPCAGISGGAEPPCPPLHRLP